MQAQQTHSTEHDGAFTPNPHVARLGLALVLGIVGLCFLVLIVNGANGSSKSGPQAAPAVSAPVVSVPAVAAPAPAVSR